LTEFLQLHYNGVRQLSHCKTKINQIWQQQACILN